MDETLHEEKEPHCVKLCNRDTVYLYPYDNLLKTLSKFADRRPNLYQPFDQMSDG